MKERIDVRSIKTHKQLSEETLAYTAKVFLDGRHVLDASNHGHGAADMYHLAKGATKEQREELVGVAKDIIAERGTVVVEGYTFSPESMASMALEVIVHEIIYDKEEQKILRRLCKKHLTVRSPEGEVFTYNVPYSPEAAQKVLSQPKFSDYEVVNERFL